MDGSGSCVGADAAAVDERGRSISDGGGLAAQVMDRRAGNNVPFPPRGAVDSRGQIKERMGLVGDAANELSRAGCLVVASIRARRSVECG